MDNWMSRIKGCFDEYHGTPTYSLVYNIVHYVAAQGLDDEESIATLQCLLDGSGISDEKIKSAFNKGGNR